MIRILALLLSLAAGACGAVNPLLQFDLQDIGAQLARGHASADFFTVIADGTVKVYDTSAKASAITQTAATAGFAGWRSVNGADLARIAYSTSDSYPTGAINAGAYGIDPTDTTDSTTGLQAAINAAAAAGGGVVYIPAGVYKLTAPLTFPAAGKVVVQGAGSGGTSDTATPYTTAATALRAEAAMASMFSATASGARGCSAIGLLDVYLDANSLAVLGLDLNTIKNSDFERIVIDQPTTGAVSISVVASLSTDPIDSQGNVFDSIRIRCTAAAAASAYGFKLNGITAGNTSYNTFRDLRIKNKDGVGVDCANCDSNFFYMVKTQTTGTGYGMVFREDATATGLNARHNAVFGASLAPSGGGTGGVHFEGTGAGTNSDANIIYGYIRSNAAPVPVFDTGAKGFVVDNYGQRFSSAKSILTGPTTSNAVQVANQLYVTVDTSGGQVTINGMAGGVNGQEMQILNAGANNLVLINNNAGGTQKILTKSGANVTIVKGVARLRCDGTFWYEN